MGWHFSAQVTRSGGQVGGVGEAGGGWLEEYSPKGMRCSPIFTGF